MVLYDNDVTPATGRTARPRRYLMCEPTYFDVSYSINPWMQPEVPTSADRGVRQWRQLYDLLSGLGHKVELVDPVAGLPDMVYAANGATVIDGKALVARFRHEQRAGESEPYQDWLALHGFPQARIAERINEGEGDFLLAGEVILGGSGFRSAPESHQEMRDFFGREVVSLTLVDPRYYHLDTALAVLSDEEIMYHPPAFSPESREALQARYPDAILVDEQDAAVFGLNAVSDGLHVVIAEQATRLPGQLRERGFAPIGVDTSELLKGGGGAKCCVLELRDAG